MSKLEIHLRSPLSSFDLDVHVETEARTLGLFGPSGAGKTSVLEAIAGWRPPQSGSIRCGGRTLFDSRSGVDLGLQERGVGYVPQDTLLFPHWTVRQNVLAAGGSEAAFVQRVVRALELGDLLERRPATLSGGESRRVALARALCSRPKILLCDEPLAAMDRALRVRVLSDIVRVRKLFDITLVLVSHDATEITAVCDEVCVLERGRVVAGGAPAQVLRARASLSASFENVVSGSVCDVDGNSARIELDGGPIVHVAVPHLAPGQRVWLGLDAEDVLVAETAPTRISARNVLRATIESLASDNAGRVRLVARLVARLGQGERSPTLAVDVTHAAAIELALDRGRAVHLVFKASSCRLVAQAV